MPRVTTSLRAGTDSRRVAGCNQAGIWKAWLWQAKFIRKGGLQSGFLRKRKLPCFVGQKCYCTCRIDMPIQMPTACAFGGKELDELYITSTELGGGKGAGGLWRFKLEGLKGISAAHLATVQSS